MNRYISYLVGQGVEGRSFSSVKASRGGSVAKATRGGVRLDDDFSTVVGSSFGVLSEGQFLTFNLFTHDQYKVRLNILYNNCYT